VLLVGVLDKVGIFGFLRYNLPLFPTPATPWPAAAGAGRGRRAVRSILAAGQSDMKRFIAYVSLAHFGFMALGVFAFTVQGQVGAVSYMVNHSIATGMLLIVIGMVIVRAGPVRAEDYGGLARSRDPRRDEFLAGLTTLPLPGTNFLRERVHGLIGSFQTQPVYSILATVGMVLRRALRPVALPARDAGTGAWQRIGGRCGGPGAAMDRRSARAWASATCLGRALGARADGRADPAARFYPKPLLDIRQPVGGATLHSIGSA